MRALARWGALPMLATPFGAWALGLGDIELRSALNQPFSADISLVSATPEELEGLRVSLASQETFARYGLDRPAFLGGLDFSVTRDALGRDVIRVTSRQSMTEPFVTLLIEASWARGRLLREYTVLLDPPVLLPSPAMPAQVQPAESFAPQAGAGDIDRPAQPPAAAQPAPQPAPQAVQPPAAQPAPQPAPAPAAAAAAPAQAADGTWTVQRAETLWNIASQLQPQGVTMNQTMVALYEANPQAFDGNMNMLRAGAVLRIPDAQTLAGRSATAASQEFQRQLADWQTGADQQARLRLVAPGEEAAPEAAAAAPAADGPADAPAGASPAEVARLQQDLASAQAELEENRRLLEMRNEELAALQARLGAAEEAAPADPPVTDAAPAAAPGVDLESEPLFADELPADEAAASEAGVAEPAEAAAAVDPEPAAVPVAAPAAPQPSLLDRALGWLASPLLWIALGVIALVGALVWFLRARRSEDDEDLTGRWEQLEADVDDQDIDALSATARMRREAAEESFVVEEQGRRQDSRQDSRREPGMGAAAAGAAAAGAVAAAGRAGQADDRNRTSGSASSARADELTEFSPDAEAGRDVSAGVSAAAGDDTLSSQTLVNLDQSDLLAEADFHMAYGLYDQAAELLTKGLEQDPGRRDLRLKLLEVYFVWGNREAFVDAARVLHDEIGDGRDGDWDKVVIMGKQICPDEPIIASAIASAGEVDMALDAGDSDSVDFMFESQHGTDAKSGAGVDVDFGEVTGSDVEFRLDDDAAASTGIDFDFTDAATDDAVGGDRDGARAAAVSGASSFDSLDIGEHTAAGIQAAILSDDDEDDDEGQTGVHTHTDIDPLAATQESPTVESQQRPDFGHGDDDATEETPRFDAPTVESPALEVPGFDTPTMESPTLESRAQGGDDATQTISTGDDVDADGDRDRDATWLAGVGDSTAELPTVEQPGLKYGSEDHSDYTAEINLDDLGLDVRDLNELPEDLGDLPGAGAGTETREQPQLSADDGDQDGDDRFLSATGITEVLGGDDDFEHEQTSILSPDDLQGIADPDSDSSLARTEVLKEAEDDDHTGSTSMIKALNVDDLEAGGDKGNDLDLDLDDLPSMDSGETVEQPRAPQFSSELFADDSHTPIDLDVGSDSAIADDEPTGTEESDMGAEALTEVGTKLDLARAYIDMGDPEGARSILEEVLDEGDSGQRSEARELIDTLGA